MEYPLERLENLVSRLIEIGRNSSQGIPLKDSEDLVAVIQTESENLEHTLIRQVFQLSSPRLIEQLIQHYQSALTEFLDRLYLEQKAFSIPSAQNDLYLLCYPPLLHLLSFVEERFSKYFDTREKLPDFYFQLAKKEILEIWQRLFSTLQAVGDDRIVLEAVWLDYERFTENPTAISVSYSDLMYRKMVLKEFESLETSTGKKRDSSVFTAIVRLMVYVNYNDKVLIQLIINKLEKILLEITDLRDQVDLALQFSKELNQITLKPEAGLHPWHPSVNVQVGQWLAEELYYLERRLSMFAVEMKSNSREIKPIVKCMIPVDQIGIFFRAATDAHLLSTPSQKKLFEHIAPFLSTARRHNLSADSMRSKSYSPERKDVEGVKEMLMLMYRQVANY